MSDGTMSPPPDPESFVREVDSAVRRSDLAHAVALAREGLAQGIDHPLLLHLRAHGLSDEGRYEDALKDLECARELSPSEPRIPNGIGECLVKAERYAEAVPAFEAALRLWPDYPLARYNLGFALESLGEPRLAEEAYRRAAAVDPEYADPLARLAGLAAERLDWTSAASLAQRALMIDAQNVMAHLALAKSDLAAGERNAAEERIRTVLGNERIDALERASATKLLGDILDRQDRIDDAFATYAAANEQFRDFFGPRLAARNIEPTPVFAERIAAYVRDLPQMPTGQSSNPRQEAAGLVFLLGFPRSGTTLLGQILAAHPDVVTLEEKLPIIDADRDFLRTPGGLERLQRTSEGDLEPYRRSYWKYVHGFGVHVRDKVIVDKLPMHTFRLPLIARLFPTAKILFALRDPRDVVWSAYRRPFMINAFTYELLRLESAASLYDAVMRLRELCLSKLSLALLDVKQEDVTRSFDTEVQKVCHHLGLPWRSSMRRFAETAVRQNIATPSSSQVRAGLNEQGIGQWRRYGQQLAPVLPVLQPWVEKFGYPAE